MRERGETSAGRPHLAAIWAQSHGGVLAIDGQMPWHIPAEFAHFKATTRGSTVVMGRRTWDSLEGPFRPLPGRRNVVLTRDESFTAEGGEVMHSLQDAARLPSTTGTTWVLGGGEIYRALLPVTDTAVVTEVDCDPTREASAEAEITYAPELPAKTWHEVPAELLDERLRALRSWQEDGSNPRWRVVVYQRTQ